MPKPASVAAWTGGCNLGRATCGKAGQTGKCAGRAVVHLSRLRPDILRTRPTDVFEQIVAMRKLPIHHLSPDFGSRLRLATAARDCGA